VAGADFSEADLAGANFCRADLSRANFRGAKGLGENLFGGACVGKSIEVEAVDPGPKIDEDAQPSGLDVIRSGFKIPRCISNEICGR